MQRATGELVREVDWGVLSDHGLETLRTIALPISCGLSYQEVAEQRGITHKAVSKALDDLAKEIRRQALVETGTSSPR
jgi:hypothetical protein